MSATISEVAEEHVTALIKDNPGKTSIEMEFREYATDGFKKAYKLHETAFI
jgi:hypothetical protein